jgi:hypothetical protein
LRNWKIDMATPASRRAPAAEPLLEESDALGRELIALERETEPQEARKATIKARLKQLAEQRGESFPERRIGRGGDTIPFPCRSRRTEEGRCRGPASSTQSL